MMIQSKYCYAILCFLLHTLPAHVVDTAAKLVGKKPKYVISTCKLKTKLYKLLSYSILYKYIFNICIHILFDNFDEHHKNDKNHFYDFSVGA